MWSVQYYNFRFALSAAISSYKSNDYFLHIWNTSSHLDSKLFIATETYLMVKYIDEHRLGGDYHEIVYEAPHLNGNGLSCYVPEDGYK